MVKRILTAVALAILSLPGTAQIKWPATSNLTKPWTRWWWLGSAVNNKDLSQNLETYAAAGLGGVEITPIYGVHGAEKQFIDYLSPQWMQVLTHTLQEAKRLNLQVDMATGSGWPFGGGPLIGPEDACKDFAYKTYSVKAGEQLNEAITFTQEPYTRKIGNTLGIATTDQLSEPFYNNKDLQALAIDQIKFRKPLPLQVLMAYNENGQTADLTTKVDAAGKLNWTAPAGNWTLYAVFMGWHGKMVERAAPGAEGDVIDHFSQPALTKYLSRFDKAFAGKDLSYMRGFFNDSYEVDDARGQANYTPNLFAEFKKRRGYDLKEHLPALLTKQPDTRILFDYRQTIADLLLEKFTMPWQQWAKAKGKIVRNQSHGSPANIIDLYGAVDIPETEGTELLRFKFAASASHVLGKPLVAAEAATWLNEHFRSSLGDVKNAIDKYFIGGVNHIVYHGTSYSPQSEPWPGWLFYAAVHFQPVNPLWKDFGALNDYVSRCQSFLQSGKADNDVLLYFPFSDRNSEPPTSRGLLHHFDGMEGFEKSDFDKVAEELLHKGYAFDLISDKQIIQLTGLKNYKTIVLANTKYLPVATLQKLLALAKAGVKILVYKDLPSGAPGMEGVNKQAQFKTLMDAFSKLVQRGDDVMELMKAIPRETMWDQGLHCVRRSIAGGKYYFISNISGKAIEGWVPVATAAKQVVIFDPMYQRSGLAKTKGKDVYLQLQPGESCVLQVSNTAVKGNEFPYYEAAGDAVAVDSKWELQFLSGGPLLPATVTLSSLGSWTTLADTAASMFSGTAQYSTRLSKPAGGADAYLLNLGKVAMSAEVWLNGKRVGTLLGPAYQLVIPASLFVDDNLLQIKVSNGMANRIIDMEKKGMEYRKFYNVNFPSRLAENRRADGLFTTANWQPEVSGLTGPVTLTPLSLGKLKF